MASQGRKFMAARLFRAALALLAMQATAQAAHEHGVAHLDIVLEGERAQATLDGAADNFTGFEHAPADEAQRERVRLVRDALARLPELVVLSPGCTGAAVRVTEPASMRDAANGAAHQHHHESPDHDDGDHEHEEHANWRAVAAYACRAAAPPTRVDAAALFAAFPRLSQLRLQWFGPNGQTGAVLTADDPSLALP